MVAEIDHRLQHAQETRPRADVARDVWREHLPRTEQGLALRGLAFFTYRVTAPAQAQPDGAATLESLIRDGVLVPEPIVYEDFLPRSAAGIFQSNLTEPSRCWTLHTGHTPHRASRRPAKPGYIPNTRRGRGGGGGVSVSPRLLY